MLQTLFSRSVLASVLTAQPHCVYLEWCTLLTLTYTALLPRHSFGVLAYELLSRQLLLVSHVGPRAAAGLAVGDPKEYAQRVRRTGVCAVALGSIDSDKRGSMGLAPC